MGVPNHLRFSFSDGGRGERERGVLERSVLDNELDELLAGPLEAPVR